MTSPDAQARLKACPLCGVAMEPHAQYFSHPGNDCALAFQGFRNELMDAWNLRTPDAQPSSTEGEVELVAMAIAAAEWSRDARLRHLEHEVGDTAERYAERSWGLWTDHAAAAIAAQVPKP